MNYNRIKRFLAVFLLAIAPRVFGAGGADEIKFNRDIRPILSENCFHCHGPDSMTRKGGFRLDREDGLFGEHKHGRAIVKGDSKNSPMFQRVTSDDADEIMPPPESHKSLKPAEKEMLRRWIDEGAPWEPHWSLVAPVKPAVPGTSKSPWARTPIDAFVLARLEAAGLRPAAEADRRALIRRVTFDLTGLPPTPEEVEAFVADQSPGAYEKLVDRLLASKRYGEHRARYWLDAARYADTHGLHFDNYREIWPYRDWVITAFNANMPFDRFTIEQLAGDLLPDRTFDQQIASGFIRCGVTTNEGGTIAEENLVMYARDRTETAARVFLGLTMNCCVCHDHKFDPITQKDFYSFSAFFNNSTVAPLDGNVKDSPPVLVVPRPEDRAGWDVVSAKLAAARAEVGKRKAEAGPAFDAWAKTATADVVAAATPTAGLKLLAPFEEGTGATTRVKIDGVDQDLPVAATAQWQPGHLGAKALQAADGAPVQFPDAGDFDRGQAFTAAVWAKFPGKSTGSVIARIDDGDAFRGWDLWVEKGRIATHIVHRWPDDAIKVVSQKITDSEKWHHFCLSYDGSGKAAGVKLYVDGEAQATRAAPDTVTGTIRTKVALKVGQRQSTSPIKGLVVHDLRLYDRVLAVPEVGHLARSGRMTAILNKAMAARSPQEKSELFDWWLGNVDAESVAAKKIEAAIDRDANAIKARGAVTLVMQEKPTPATAFVLARGDYDKRKEQVEPGTPAVLPAFPVDVPRNRLGLARWLVAPGHPLTARVTVNRLWQEIFGTGLVKSSDDFGITGEEPSHPELLDWLAVDFREHGWDVKRAVRQIVLSATYRQSATTTPEKQEKDPANRLLAHGPRFRLDAESVRDNALAASGLLVDTIGGPSVRPYQPPGIWEVGMPESNTHVYQPDTGEKLYRRSMYTFWKRAAPPASMEIFNAPSRETCTVRRERTNTPLQALVTLNDPQFVEAARALAERAIQSASTPSARIDLIARRVLSRPLRPAEESIATAALTDLLAYYSAHADDAAQLLSVGESKRDESINPGEHAAWTLFASQIMNLDEALNK